MSSPKDKVTSARSPIAGCAILTIAMLVMVFLIVFSVVVLFRQFDAIVKFTSEESRPVKVLQVEGNESEINALGERIEVFRKGLDGKDAEVAIELTARDINLAIASYERLEELRETFYVTEIGEDSMRISINFMLNGKPRMTEEGESGMVTSDNRYLTAVMVAKPVLLEGEVALQVKDIQVEGKEVPREFIEQMSPYRITERYLADGVVAPLMAQLTRVGLSDGRLVLAMKPGEVPSDEITDEQVDAKLSGFLVIFGTAACIFLLFAGTVVMIGLRKSAKEPKNENDAGR